MKKLGIILATGLAFTSCQHFEKSIGENAKNIEKNSSEIKTAKKDRDALYVKVFDVEKNLDKKIGKNTKSISGLKGDVATLYKSAVKFEESGGSSAAEYAKLKREIDKARRDRKHLHKEVKHILRHVHDFMDDHGHKHGDKPQHAHKHKKGHKHKHGDKKGHDHGHKHKHDHAKKHEHGKMSKDAVSRLKKIEKDLEKAQKEIEELRITLAHNKKTASVLEQKIKAGGQNYDELSKLKAAQKLAKAEREQIRKQLAELDNELASQVIAKDQILKQQASSIDASLSLKSDVSSLKKKLLT